MTLANGKSRCSLMLTIHIFRQSASWNVWWIIKWEKIHIVASPSRDCTGLPCYLKSLFLPYPLSTFHILPLKKSMSKKQTRCLKTTSMLTVPLANTSLLWSWFNDIKEWYHNHSESIVGKWLCLALLSQEGWTNWTPSWVASSLTDWR